MSSLVAGCFGPEAGSDGREYECGVSQQQGQGPAPTRPVFQTGTLLDQARLQMLLECAGLSVPQPNLNLNQNRGLSFRSCRTGSVDRTAPPVTPRVANNALHSHSNSHSHSPIDTSQNGGTNGTAPFPLRPTATTGVKTGLPPQAPRALVNSLPPAVNGSSASSTSQHIHLLPPRPETLPPPPSSS
jgi:hypothetical protein